jgi:hypothetical protein
MFVLGDLSVVCRGVASSPTPLTQLLSFYFLEPQTLTQDGIIKKLKVHGVK